MFQSHLEKRETKEKRETEGNGESELCDRLHSGRSTVTVDKNKVKQADAILYLAEKAPLYNNVKAVR